MVFITFIMLYIIIDDVALPFSIIYIIGSGIISLIYIEMIYDIRTNLAIILLSFAIGQYNSLHFDNKMFYYR